ncbi:MAG TPA: hypothetical protein VGD67_05660, partial [Pseudonocardiaceae bacterium]
MTAALTTDEPRPARPPAFLRLVPDRPPPGTREPRPGPETPPQPQFELPPQAQPEPPSAPLRRPP